ncbi:MAG TPA: hypothetical protein VHT97_11045 [Acidimicrobiales bacterium]|jgi:hypothetical protein|nr:hypothetical protein [Acidimicrobiales bacterium]
MELAVNVIVFALGAVAALGTLGSAVRTVVLPRGVPAKLSTVVFVAVRKVFRLRLGRSATYERRDAVMAGYAPAALMVLVVVWLAITLVGYTAMFWAFGTRNLGAAFTDSGSSLTTLGFSQPRDLPSVVLAFTEAGLGLTLLAMLITYLPSLYGAFSRRESAVALLEVRAGSPPFGAAMLERYARIGWMGGLAAIWDQWETWFVEVEESHTSFAALGFFRSPQPDHSWITAAGAVLDAAALSASTLRARDPDANLCVRAGYVALRRIADYYALPYNPDPGPDDPISVAREEYDEVYDRLAAAGIDLNPDRDQAWRDFAGWRVNYDVVLVSLCAVFMAPYAPWSSDRSVAGFRVHLLRRQGPRSAGPPRRPA